MSKQIDTTEFQFSHGHAPRGYGNWGFRLDTPNTCDCDECREQEEFWVNGTFTEARKALPKGSWKVLS